MPPHQVEEFLLCWLPYYEIVKSGIASLKDIIKNFELLVPVQIELEQIWEEQSQAESAARKEAGTDYPGISKELLAQRDAPDGALAFYYLTEDFKKDGKCYDHGPIKWEEMENWSFWERYYDNWLAKYGANAVSEHLKLLEEMNQAKEQRRREKEKTDDEDEPVVLRALGTKLLIDNNNALALVEPKSGNQK